MAECFEKYKTVKREQNFHKEKDVQIAAFFAVKQQVLRVV